MSFVTDHPHPHMYRQDDMQFAVQYSPFSDYTTPGDRFADSSAAETRSPIYSTSSTQIHPHPLFTRQDNPNVDVSGSQNHQLDPHSLNAHHQLYQTSSQFPVLGQQQPSHQNWAPYDQQVPHQFAQTNSQFSYPSFPSQSPFPPARLSPPLRHHQPFTTKGQHQASSPATNNSRLALAGSLDPATGIFYRTPEHPRLRTAQACEKCRTRKAKCSGEHPSCKRCVTRGLVCEYAKEGRVRGPNKQRPKTNPGTTPNDQTPATNVGIVRTGPRNRTISATSSSGSSDLHDLPSAVRAALGNSPQGLRSGTSSRRNSLSLSDQRSARPRPSDLNLDSSLNVARVTSGDLGRAAGHGLEDVGYIPYQHHAGHPRFLSEDQRQLQQYQMHRNMMAVRGAPGTALRASSSLSSLKRVQARDSEFHTDSSVLQHPLSATNSNNFPHTGLQSGLASPIDSLADGDFFGTAQYVPQSSELDRMKTEDVAGQLASLIPNASGSPQMSVSAGTTSTMGSPLTPASTSTSSSHLPLLNSTPSSDGKYTPTGLDLTFEIDPALIHPGPDNNDVHHEQIVADSAVHNGQPLPAAGADHQGFYPGMDLPVC